MSATAALKSLSNKPIPAGHRNSSDAKCFIHRSEHWPQIWWHLVIGCRLSCWIRAAGCHILLQVSTCFQWYILMLLLCLPTLNSTQYLSDFLQIDLWCYVLLINGVNRSRETTQACKNGRSTSIRLRCDPTVTVKDHVSLPRYKTKMFTFG